MDIRNRGRKADFIGTAANCQTQANLLDTTDVGVYTFFASDTNQYGTLSAYAGGTGTITWETVSGSAKVYGLARNLQVAGVGTTNVEFFGLICSIVPGADIAITPVGGSGSVTGIDPATFTPGQVYPIHGTSITVTTSGEFLLLIADA